MVIVAVGHIARLMEWKVTKIVNDGILERSLVIFTGDEKINVTREEDKATLRKFLEKLNDFPPVGSDTWKGTEVQDTITG